MHNWLVQDAALAAGNGNIGNAGPVQHNAGWRVWPAPPAPPLPPLPPHLVNYQAWLVAQGLTVQHGVVPKNNITDNAMEAWNDAISSSDDSSDDAPVLLMVPSAATA